MIVQYVHLTNHPAVFHSLTGLSRAPFDVLCADVLSLYAEAERLRHTRPDRVHAIGGGSRFTLTLRDHPLMTVVWLRVYPTYPLLGCLLWCQRVRGTTGTGTGVARAGSGGDGHDAVARSWSGASPSPG